MKRIIDIPEDVYTRLFDNGIQDNEITTDDICEMARALRFSTLHETVTEREDYKFVNGIEQDPIYICDPNKSPCKGSEICYQLGGCFYTTDKDRALDTSTPLYMAESLIKVKENQNVNTDQA